MKSLAIPLWQTRLWIVWFTPRIRSICREWSPYASATLPRSPKPAHRTEKNGSRRTSMPSPGSALIDRKELLPLSRQTPLWVARERNREPRKKADTVDATCPIGVRNPSSADRQRMMVTFARNRRSR
jgi:hypothetical protein